MSDKLFAVYLGGRAPKGNTELHDVVFVTGAAIEDTYDQLMDQWFGTPQGLHLDSWIELDIVDGYRVGLSPTKSDSQNRLYFVNLGAYQDGVFGELHDNKWLVAASVAEAKRRAKSELFRSLSGKAHTDDVYEVDSCVEVGQVNRFHVVLAPTAEKTACSPVNGYHLIPKRIVEDYMRRHGLVDGKTYRAYS